MSSLYEKSFITTFFILLLSYIRITRLYNIFCLTHLGNLQYEQINLRQTSFLFWNCSEENSPYKIPFYSKKTYLFSIKSLIFFFCSCNLSFTSNKIVSCHVYFSNFMTFVFNIVNVLVKLFLLFFIHFTDTLRIEINIRVKKIILSTTFL